MKAAVPLVLEQDFITSKNVVARMVNGDSGAYQMAAGEVLRTTLESRGGRISIEATLTDVATQRNRQVIRVEGPFSAGLLSPVNALAKRLNDGATNFSTQNERALEIFTAAAETSNLERRIQLLNDAIHADPAFGLAYLALLETRAQAGQDTRALIATAASQRSSFRPVDRVRFDAMAARLSHAPLTAQEKAASAVLQLAPNQLDALAALGSERFLAGDGLSGERLFRQALELSPGNPNLRQQLALGLLETRRFAEAEKVFVGIDNNPAILPELAVCIFLEGDTNRADIVFNRYLSLRPANDPFSTLFRATWLAISGRTTKAVDSVEAAKFTDSGLGSLALSEAAMWQLMAGDRAAATRTATEAFRLDARPASFAAVALLVTRANEPAAQWRAQVSASALNEQTRQTVLAYGFFLNHDYTEAAQMWQQIVASSGGVELRARAMLAASLADAGRAADAQKVLVEPFVPDFGDLYAAISFNEMRKFLKLP